MKNQSQSAAVKALLLKLHLIESIFFTIIDKHVTY